MYAVVANEMYKNIIKTAIGVNSTVVFEAYGIVNIKQIIAEINRLSISTLIIHSSVSEASDINEAIKRLKVLRPRIRVIFISPESKPGDRLIKNLITKGVYDIFCPKKEKSFREIAIKLQSIIYGEPATYADAVRWDVTNPKPGNSKITTIPVTTALVLNVSKCAGSTFIATSLAGALSRFNITPAVVELPTKPYYFDALGITLLEHKGASFYSYPHVISNNIHPETGLETISDSIIWLVSDSRLEPIKNWSYSEMMRLLYCCKKAGVIIVDGGSNLHKDCIESLIPVVDVVVAVIDPLPVQLIRAEKSIKKLLGFKEKGANVVFAVNKWPKGLKKTDFSKLIEVKPHTFIPCVDQTKIYKAAYSCSIPYSIASVQEQLAGSLRELIKELLPETIIKEVSKKRMQLFKKR